MRAVAFGVTVAGLVILSYGLYLSQLELRDLRARVAACEAFPRGIDWP